MTRRGFTLLEMMLATLLASFVLLACAGVFAYIDRTERALAGRFDDVQEFARCQATLRRAFQSLVAAYPQATTTPGAASVSNEQTRAQDNPQPFTTEDEGQVVRPGASSERSPRGARVGRRSSRAQPDDGGDPEADADAFATDDGRPNEEDAETDRRRAGRLGRDEDEEVVKGPEYLSLKPLRLEDQQRGAEVGDAPWRLEVVLSAPPYALAAEREGPVRAAIDIVETDPAEWETEYPEWALVWTPITPPGEPRVLIDGLALALMAVLPRDSAEFTGNFGARQIKEFPRAVRFILWTRGGAKTDWVFEPGIIEGVAP